MPGRETGGLRRRPLGAIALEWIGVIGAAVFSARVAGRLAIAVDDGWDACALLGGALVGVLAADVVSGLVHWAGDNFLAADTPVIGPALIAGFREHHRDPEAILRHGWLERNGMNALAVVPALAVADVVLAAATPPGPQLFAGGALAALAWALALTNELHAWSHAPAPPAPVRLLQRLRLVLPPAVHARHHDGRFNSHYCVTTGWSNPIVDRMVRGRAGARAEPRTEELCR